LDGLQRIVSFRWGSLCSTTASALATATTATASASDAKTEAGIVDANTVGNEGVVTFDGQVVDRAIAELGLADNGAEVAVVVNEAVVRTERVDFDEGIELVENPVVRCGIKMLSAPERVADDAFVFVFVNLKDLGFVDFARVVKAQDQIASLQFINAALAAWNRDKRMP
jgi:hypothetical protein